MLPQGADARACQSSGVHGLRLGRRAFLRRCLAVWSPPAHAEVPADRLLMRLPNNFRELELTREQWQGVWKREYAQWQQGLGAEMIAEAQEQRELRLVATGSYIW